MIAVFNTRTNSFRFYPDNYLDILKAELDNHFKIFPIDEHSIVAITGTETFEGDVTDTLFVTYVNENDNIAALILPATENFVTVLAMNRIPFHAVLSVDRIQKEDLLGNVPYFLSK